MPSMVGCMACVPAVDEKVWCLLSVFLSCFGMTKFVITETPWCSVIFKPVIVSLRRGRFVVVELYSTFSVDLQNFPSGKFVPKITIFHDFGGCKPTFLRHSLLHAKFCKKNRLRGYTGTPFGQIYTKNINFGDFGAVYHIFKPQWWNLAWGCGPGTPSQ